MAKFMFKLKYLARLFYVNMAKLTWGVVFTIILLHMAVSFFGLTVAAEPIIKTNIDFLYFWIVTSSTVGYGDMSPTTELGKMLVMFWMIPGGIGIFGMLLGKISTGISGKWRKKMHGHGDFSKLEDHIVIFGWTDTRTRRMIDLIFGDEKRENREIVLCTTNDMENPFPDLIHFVRGDSLTSDDLLLRSGVKTAARVIILGVDDHETLAASLAVYNETRSDSGRTEHIVAYFQEENIARMFKKHCPTAECAVSLSVESLVRAAQDPGSTRIQEQLLSTLIGPTQFSLTVPDGFEEKYGKLFTFFKDKHEATLFGVASTLTGDDLTMNAPSDFNVLPGNILYFMASSRIKAKDVNWETIS